MASDIKFFRLFVVASVILYPALYLLLFYLLIIHLYSGQFDTLTILFLSSFLIFLGNAVIVLQLIRKYPADGISNAFEAFIYVAAILSFITTPIAVFFDFTIVNVYTGMSTPKKDILRPLMLVSTIASAFATAFYIAINSFRLLKLIKKNRTILAQQIKNIGAGE
jgi:glucan phosphoethanolaminetransferase (alkaline phosphatase superfamily)